MSNKSTNLRLDEILLFEGLVNEEQVREALEYKKQYGCKIGSHLLRLGYVDEAGLLMALERQSGCRGVNLSGIDIPGATIKLIPAKVAMARRIVPFEFDAENNVLSVACEDPNDESLFEELSFVAEGTTIELYIAPEISIKAAIAIYYFEAAEQSTTSTLAMERTVTFASETDADENSPDTNDHVTSDEVQQDNESGGPYIGAVLLVTDDLEADAPLRQAMELEYIEVVTSDSADDAIDMIGGREFRTVFIRDTVPGDYIDLIDRLRKISPDTQVRYYESAGQLLLEDKLIGDHADLMARNLDLLTTLLTSKEKLSTNHSGSVGHYADRLCRWLGLSGKDRIAIINAAYLHDIARFYYSDPSQSNDERSLIKLSAKLLNSLDYSPLVIGILKAMYKNLGGRFKKRLPIEALGGNIVTVADIFCENLPQPEKITLEQFDKIEKMFNGLVGKLFLAEVSEAFLNMIQEEILITDESQHTDQVMIYSEAPETALAVEERLKIEGFSFVTERTIEPFADLFKRSRPDLIILIKSEKQADVIEFVDSLISLHVAVDQVPTFLLTENTTTDQVTSMLERGIEDVIAMDDNLDLLIVKIKKTRDRLVAEPKQLGDDTQVAVTRGSLSDMNLIDLLQAMGPSGKTVRIAAVSDEKQLVVFLKQGAITCAEFGDKTGAEAVYEGLSWNKGKWSVEPVRLEDIPESNNEFSNESILMEGCRLIDEQQRSSQAGAASVSQDRG
jgi:DNA-binding response OmpR family regulator